jgi:hypothetical protein
MAVAESFSQPIPIVAPGADLICLDWRSTSYIHIVERCTSGFVSKDIIGSRYLYLPDLPFRWISVGRAFQELALRTRFTLRSDHINKNDSPVRLTISHFEIRPLSPTKQTFCPTIQ